MSNLWLRCTRCEACFGFAVRTAGCPACQAAGLCSPLEVAYNYPLRLGARGARAVVSNARTFWDFAPLLPVDEVDRRALLDLGQGLTPLVSAGDLGNQIGLPRLFFKIEGANPTWSFKDRYVAVTLSVARAAGFERVVASSTGNLAASVAAFAARGGLGAVVLCPPETSPALVALISAYGARVLIMDWDLRLPVMFDLARRGELFPVGLFMPWPVSNPFGIEGYKTIAYELHQQLGPSIDLVAFPCARGNGLYGTWKGFRELRDFGMADRTPRMVAVQPEGAASLPEAFAARAAAAVAVTNPASVATSIRESVASDDALQAVYASQGVAVAVSDDEIVGAARALGLAGISVELASAAAFAGVRRLAQTGQIDAQQTIVCVLTAAGIKWPKDFDLLLTRNADVHRVATSDEALRVALLKQTP